MPRPEKIFFAALVFFVLPTAVFVLVYRLTDAVFRQLALPYPSERFGIVAAAAAACWTLAAAAFVRKQVKKRRTS